MDLLATFKSALCANLVFMSTENSPVRTENLFYPQSSLYYDFCSFSNDVFFFLLLELWLATNSAKRQQNKNNERPEFCLLKLFNNVTTGITKDDPSGALNLYIHSQIYSERFSQLFSLSLNCADISVIYNLGFPASQSTNQAYCNFSKPEKRARFSPSYFYFEMELSCWM